MALPVINVSLTVFKDCSNARNRVVTGRPLVTVLEDCYDICLLTSFGPTKNSMIVYCLLFQFADISNGE